MKRVSWLPEVHSLAALALGLWFALGKGNSVDVIKVAAYMVGSEVLWRMCGGGFFYEFGKYAFALTLGAALLRQRNYSLDPVAMFYFVLLLPAAVPTLLESSPAVAKNNLSFYLSGPLALTIGVSFFKPIRLSPAQLQSVLLVLLAPIIGAAAICYNSTFGADEITFGASSNMAASGGFGPNQVSAVLGFGILTIALCVWVTPVPKLLGGLLVGAALLFFAQALLTLSRTGIYLAAISCALGGVQLVRNPRQLAGLAAGAAVVGLACWLVVIPAVEHLSGGAVVERFRNTSGTGREDIVHYDLLVWAGHPLFGVGIGMSPGERMKLGGIRHAAHTEYARLLSEHGTLGAVSLVLMLYMAVRAFRSARTVQDKVLTASAASFALLFMSVSAMRLGLPALTLGLACVRQPGLATPLNRSKAPTGAFAGRFPIRKPQNFRLRARGFLQRPADRRRRTLEHFDLPGAV
jgi:hypothetical protein